MTIYMVNEDKGLAALLCEDDLSRAEELLEEGFVEVGRDAYERVASRIREQLQEHLAGGVGYA